MGDVMMWVGTKFSEILKKGLQFSNLIKRKVQLRTQHSWTSSDNVRETFVGH